MTPEECASWCHKNGIFPHHLEQWKKAAISAMAASSGKKQSDTERQLRKENSALKKDLSRKEKALAETAALLVLKKKAQAIWGGARGRLISFEDKQSVLQLISDACDSGARRSMAAKLLGLTIRTLQRWAKKGMTDKRKGSRAVPGNKLSDEERQRIINVLQSQEFAELTPNQTVPRLADQGLFLGSESTMYRILRELKMNTHRQASQPSQKVSPVPLWADGP